MKKMAILLISFVLLLSCSLPKMPQDIKGWHDLHKVLMTAKVPKWIYDGKKSENYCFRRIPEKAQRWYIQNFWEIREKELRDVFYGRVQTANYFFRGWRNDRGYVVLTCGYPVDIRYIKNHNRRDPGKVDIEGNKYQIWSYWYRGRMMSITFEYRLSDWRLAQASTHSINNLTELIRANQKIFQPTEEGWNIVATGLLEWLRDETGEKK